MNPKDKAAAWRLLNALMDMGERETVLLNHGELDHVLELQRRMQPLVQRISELAPKVADDEMRQAAMQLLEVRQQNHLRLGHELAQLDLERKKANRSHGQLLRLKPGYNRRSTSRLLHVQA